MLSRGVTIARHLPAAVPPRRRSGRRAAAATFALGLALAFGVLAHAAEVTLRTDNGLELGLDDATGAVSRVAIDGVDATETTPYGGLYVRDRARITDVPLAAPNLLPNGSFETDADANGMPDGWVFQPGAGGATFTYLLGGIDGAWSVRLGQPAGGEVYQLDVPVSGRTRYLFQARIRGQGLARINVVWKTIVGEFILYEYGHDAAADPTAWRPVHAVLTAPPFARLADVAIANYGNGDLDVDAARMDTAPPTAFSAVAGSVVPTPTGARQSAAMAALDLVSDATYTVHPDRIDVDVRLTDTLGVDRAIEAGMILPVLPALFWDTPRRSRVVTQNDYSETFAYTYWGRIYNDGPWGHERSVYPFAALTLNNGTGLAMGYDVSAGPQDVRFFYSTFVGESFTSLFRLGLAPEPVGSPREARFRLSISRVDGTTAFRSALDAYYRTTGAFEDRLPSRGGWLPYRSPASIPGAADFGVGIHTWDNDVAGDDAAQVLTLGYTSSYDYWLPLGDYPAEPTTAEARARIDANAAGPVGDPVLQRDARAVKVSGLADGLGNQVLEVYQAPWMPGSGWSAVCAIDPDPEVTDRTGNGWASRFDVIRQDLDLRFARAQTAGAVLDGAFYDWFPSWHGGEWNHRRTHWETCDTSLSFDPRSLTPALPEPFAHWESASAITMDMRARGLFTMARNVNLTSFWASPLLDAMGQGVNWQRYPDDDDTLLFYRSVAGRKPYLLTLDADFETYDVGHALRLSLLYGLLPTPNYDDARDADYWDSTAHMDRDRPLFRKFVPLFRLQASAGWEPLTLAAVPDAPLVGLERWGTAAGGTLLFSAWNAGPAPASATVTIDLAALGIPPAAVGRVVDLVEAGVLPARINGSALEVTDTLAPDAARLYHVHLASPASLPIVLLASKSGADVALTWTDQGRRYYELLAGPARDLRGASVELVPAPAATRSGAVPVPPTLYFAVE